MRPLGGYGDRSLQSMPRKGAEASSFRAAECRLSVRGDHQIFVERSGSSLAASVMESSKLLKSVGSAGRSSNGGFVGSSGLGVVSPQTTLQLQPRQIPEVAHRYRGSARELFAALQASPVGSLAAPVVGGTAGERHSSSSRSPSRTNASPRGSGDVSNSPRMVTVKDFQRGTPLVAPAQLLPFTGPEGLSPGRRRRQAEMMGGRSILDPARGVPRQQKDREDLADGVTAILVSVERSQLRKGFAACWGDLGFMHVVST
ncbi:unnamed protein product [Effrenium voratum]|nr:unnamed protein product [Effrenium voratum]